MEKDKKPETSWHFKPSIFQAQLCEAMDEFLWELYHLLTCLLRIETRQKIERVKTCLNSCDHDRICKLTLH